MRFDVEFFFSCFPKLLLKIPYTMYLGLISFFLCFCVRYDIGNMLYV